jgi:hypothetical protein
MLVRINIISKRRGLGAALCSGAYVAQELNEGATESGGAVVFSYVRAAVVEKASSVISVVVLVCYLATLSYLTREVYINH